MLIPPSIRTIWCFVLALVFLAGSGVRAETTEVNGKALPGLESFDSEVLRLMEAWNIPGASLAVAKDGHLLLAKAYGVSDRESKSPATPDTLFRMGSINKTVTAVAILKLVEEGKLSLNDRVLPLLAKAGVVPTRLGDERIRTITVHHLLQHSAGMDREKSGDPFFRGLLREVARRQGQAPVTCEAIAKDMLERTLDFAPGERHSYSNAGYCMLGKVIEAASGEPYLKYVSRTITQPTIGKAFLKGKSIEPLPGETRYHPWPGQANAIAAPGISAAFGVPEPYGSYPIESMDALGAWVATPTEVLKFFLAIDGARGERLLSANSLGTMQAAPIFSGAGRTAIYYALGVRVRPTPKGNNWWHSGSQPGVETLALRTAEGYAWVIAFNTRPPDKDKSRFFAEFDQALWRAARAVQVWPDGDLF
jgi:CubicO group peptidase (beta-lactamase class C family)